MANKKQVQRITKLAKEVAKSGRHIGWWYVANEVREKGEPLAHNVLEQEPFRSEIDQLCEKHKPW